MLESEEYEIKLHIKEIFNTATHYPPYNMELTLLLMQNGADPTLPDHEGSTFFNRGIHRQTSIELFTKMMSYIPQDRRKAFLNPTSPSFGLRPLERAISYDRQDLAELLMEAGAELTSVEIEAALNNPELLKFLLLEKTSLEKRQKLITELGPKNPILYKIARKQVNSEAAKILMKADADCVLQISADNSESSCKVPVNRAWIARRSPVLNALLNASFKESSQKNIEITEESPQILQQLLEFLVTGELEIHHNNFEPMMQLIDKYEIEEAVPRLKKFLSQHPECKSPKNKEKNHEIGQKLRLDLSIFFRA